MKNNELVIITVALVFFNCFTCFYEKAKQESPICSGIYTKNDILNGEQSYIKITNLLAKSEQNNKIAVAIYALEDLYNGRDALGEDYKEIACDTTSASLLCTSATPQNKEPNFKTYVVEAQETISQEIKTTNYYCVNINSNSKKEYLAEVEIRNPYGQLSGVDYPKLKFYGVMAVVYVLVVIYWTVNTIRYNDSILKIQNYILYVQLIMVIEMITNYYYETVLNKTGISNYYLMVVCVVLDSARNSLCFFILLIVCLGYGVIKPSLGKVMTRCIILTTIHFLCNCILNTFLKLTTTEEDPSFILLLFIMPLSISITTFFAWIMNGLNKTIINLENKKQQIKLKMFKRIKITLKFTIGLLLLLFVISSIMYPTTERFDSYKTKWQYQWLIIEGWQNILFLIVFLVIVYLWRPTFNNQSYGLAQLPLSENDADMLELEDNNQHQSNMNENEFDIGHLSDDNVADIFNMENESDDNEHKPK